MLIVFDSPQLHVVDYPVVDGIEVIDKRSGLGGLIRSGAAQRFREELRIFVEQGSRDEALDEMLDHFASLMNQPTVLH